MASIVIMLFLMFKKDKSSGIAVTLFHWVIPGIYAEIVRLFFTHAFGVAHPVIPLNDMKHEKNDEIK